MSDTPAAREQEAVDVVIVNWNSGEHLTECLGSLKQSARPPELRVVVIDNASRDGSADALYDVHLQRNARNLGFAVGCNQGAKLGHANSILFLNSDARVTPETIEGAVSFLQRHLAVGVVGVRLIGEDGETQRTCARRPTAVSMLNRSLGCDRIWPGSGYLMTDWAHDRSREVDHVIGAFYLIRRDLFQSLGGFDERFFLYLEDLDLSWRVQQAGWKIWYLAEPSAHHVGGGSSRRIPVQRLYLSQRARIQFAKKHLTSTGYLAILLATVLLEPIVRVLFALGRSPRAEIKGILQAQVRLWRWLFR